MSQLTSSETYRLKVRVRGRRRAFIVHSPAEAFTRLIEPMLSEIRAQLIHRAFQVVQDASIAEDIVQSSLEQVYRTFNNGKLHAVRVQKRGYLLIRGGEDCDRLLYQRQDEHAITQWLKKQADAQIDVIEKLGAWLHTVVQNAAYSYYNSRQKLLKFYEDYGALLPVAEQQFEDPENIVLRSEKCAEVRMLVAALPIHYREVVQLRFWEGCSFQVIAKRLQRPEATVRSQAMRALQMLKEAWGGQRTVKNGRMTRPQKLA